MKAVCAEKSRDTVPLKGKAIVKCVVIYLIAFYLRKWVSLFYKSNN